MNNKLGQENMAISEVRLYLETGGDLDILGHIEGYAYDWKKKMFTWAFVNKP